jgi:hypothetical protein
MPRPTRPLLLWLFAALGAWIALLELQVLLVPGLDGGPLFGDYAHNVIEVLAGVLCLAGALHAVASVPPGR